LGISDGDGGRHIPGASLSRANLPYRQVYLALLQLST